MHKSIYQLIVFTFIILSFTNCSGRTRLAPGDIPEPKKFSINDKNKALAATRYHMDKENWQLITKGDELTRVQEVYDKVRKVAGFKKDDLPVLLVDAGDTVNAVTVAGSQILVFRELLNKVKNDDELAAIIGHEFGHVLARHHDEHDELKERASLVSIGSTILGSLATAAAIATGNGAGARAIGSVTRDTATVIGTGAVVAAYDRDQEYEADQIGLLLMAKAGYDPRVAPGFWERAEEIFGAADSKLSAFWGTHPAPSDRVDLLNEIMPLAMKEYEAVSSSQ